MNELRVCCVLAAYNAERYLPMALESLLKQTYPPAEIIVVDDGSTDRTADIASAFGHPVQVIRQENAGPAAARNRGIAATECELIALLDADDLAAPDRFALQVEAFQRAPALEVCAAMMRNFEGELTFVGPAVPGYCTEIMVRRSLYERIGPSNSAHRHASELEWMLRARNAGAVECLLPEVVIYRRLHEQSLSRAETGESLREHLQVLHARIKQARSQG